MAVPSDTPLRKLQPSVRACSESLPCRLNYLSHLSERSNRKSDPDESGLSAQNAQVPSYSALTGNGPSFSWHFTQQCFFLARKIGF